MEFIKNNKPGVYIVYNGHSATFLPDVWDQIPESTDFMIELCLKGGLDPKYLPLVETYYYFTDRSKKRWEEI